MNPEKRILVDTTTSHANSVTGQERDGNITTTKDNFEQNSDIVEALVQLPVKNLESRIHELDSEINRREHLSEELLLGFGTTRLQREDRRWHLRYAGELSAGSREKQHVERELEQLRIRQSSEKLDCFRDVSNLRHRLQEAREMLELNKEKVSLIHSMPE